jgi:hypothetical protein
MSKKIVAEVRVTFLDAEGNEIKEESLDFSYSFDVEIAKRLLSDFELTKVMEIKEPAE